VWHLIPKGKKKGSSAGRAGGDLVEGAVEDSTGKEEEIFSVLFE